MKPVPEKSGFSLIEVALAVMIAGGALMSIFGLFPSALRQGVMSQEDITQSLFANSFFDAISHNTSQITDLFDWNDLATFWDTAVGQSGGYPGVINTGIYTTGSLLTIKDTDLYGNMPGVIKEYLLYIDPTGTLVTAPSGVEIRYMNVRNVPSSTSSDIMLPEQYLIRLQKIDANYPSIYNSSSALINSGVQAPAVYQVSIISTIQKQPSLFYNNSVYNMNFYFNKRRP